MGLFEVILATIPAWWETVDGPFWLAVGAGLLVRIATGERLTKRQFAATVSAGIFCAVFFSEPALHLLKLDGQYFASAVTALLALTGEHIVRRLIEFSRTGKIPGLKQGVDK